MTARGSDLVDKSYLRLKKRTYMNRFEGRAVIVTGAARGIGHACASRLAAEGALVGVADVDEQGVKEAADALDGVALHVDVSSPDSVKESFDSFVTTAGRLDGLVNCAGIVDTTPIDSITPERWNRVFDINVAGTLLCCQAALPHMTSGGAIVNIGSQAGIIGSTTSGASYAASKAAVINFTKSLAKFLAARQIRANVINPGYIDTKMHLEFTDEVRESMVNYVPLKRLGEAEEIASVVAMLLSDDGSFMTGATVNVNGGSYM
jgi:NAD(P)-dependent dehydrogenase (short-subunit alcohol dehydrogenase family)